MSHIAIDAFAGGGGASEGLRMAGVEEGIRSTMIRKQSECTLSITRKHCI